MKTLVSTFICIVLCISFAWAEPESNLFGVAAFTSQALQGQRTLFSAEELAALDKITREARVLEQRIGRSADKAAVTAAKAQLQQLRADLDALLKVHPGVIALNDTSATGAIPRLQLAGRRAGMLLKLGGGAPPVFQALRYDFSKHGNQRALVNVQEGVTQWVSLALENVPHGLTQMELELALPGGKSRIIVYETEVAAPGELSMAVRPEIGRDTCPVMMRLVWKDEERELRPANALDLSALFDQQGNYAGARAAQYPGKYAGNFWCVPGPFSMEVPAGRYELTIFHGLEYVPLTDTFDVRPGQTTVQEYRLERWENMARRGWYSGDDHVHSQILSDQDARTAMTWVQAEDVRMGNIVKMGDIGRTWFEQRGFGSQYQVNDNGYILCPGQECPRTHEQLGHTLHLNISHMIRDTSQYYLYDKVFDQVQADGGLSGYAHVTSGIFHVHRDMTMNIPKEKVDFVELLQFAQMNTDLYYDFLNLGFEITASAGSDVPWGGSVGEVRLYTYLGNKPYTAPNWFTAFDEGHTFVTNGVLIDLRVNGALPGDRISLQDDAPLQITAKAWGDARRVLPTKLQVIGNGNVLGESSGDSGQEALALDLELHGDDGGWISVRAEGSDGSRAHSTPVYVVSKNRRHWKLEAVDSLIDQRLKSLDEIQALVAESQQKNASGQVEGLRSISEFAVQGPALLERVEAARAYYEALRQEAVEQRAAKSGEPVVSLLPSL